MTLKGPGARQQTYIGDGYLPPIQPLNAAARGTAYVDIDEYSDGTARSEPAVIRFDGRYCVPLFLAMADAYLGRPPLILRFDADGVSSLEIGTRKIPVDQLGEMMVHFRASRARYLGSRLQMSSITERLPLHLRTKLYSLG